LGGCAAGGSPPSDIAARSSGAVGSTVSQTANGVGGAVQAPLRDFNLMHDAIPVALLRAQQNPYDISGMDNCPSLLIAVGDLDVALGPDIDTPSEFHHQDAYNKSASYAAQAALDAVKDTAEGVIPMKTWVRKLSGAEKADKQARRAIAAGIARRAFLKGLGVMHNCSWPAAPLAFEPVPVKAVEPPPAAVSSGPPKGAALPVSQTSVSQTSVSQTSVPQTPVPQTPVPRTPLVAVPGSQSVKN
jgi:hypothetical protein